MYADQSFSAPDPESHPEFYAGVPVKRAIAWVIDTLVVLAICALITVFTAFTALFFFPFVWMVVGLGYRVVTLANGSATLGMRMMSIELCGPSGEPLDLGGAALHTLGYAVSVAIAPLQLISIVLMAAHDRGQSLTDMFLGTVAINRRV